MIKMDRRRFLSSAGLVAMATFPGIWTFSCKKNIKKKIYFKFTRYRLEETSCPIEIVTPNDGFYIHSFYDVCPFSPSGRYLAVTKIPFQNRTPKFGDIAEICIIDLVDQSINTVFQTRAWGFQLGANLNWGVTDKFLYTNDIIDFVPVCVRIDLEQNETIAYSGPMYHISPDESCVIGFPPDLINATQQGYGVPKIPGRRNYLDIGAATKEGIWRTDLTTNKKELLVSLSRVASKASNPEFYKGGTFYFFHSKFNKQNTRILQVLRCLLPGKKGSKHGNNPQLFTFRVDGTDLCQAVSREMWAKGGNHPNWHPDGKHIIMNLTLDEEIIRFCQLRYDGSDFQVLSDKILGSGHPSIEPSGRYLISDTYAKPPFILKNNEVPIRLIDLDTNAEISICNIFTGGPGLGVLRCDPHPAWDRNYKKICFNGMPNGLRQVFVADLSNLLR